MCFILAFLGNRGKPGSAPDTRRPRPYSRHDARYRPQVCHSLCRETDKAVARDCRQQEVAEPVLRRQEVVRRQQAELRRRHKRRLQQGRPGTTGSCDVAWETSAPIRAWTQVLLSAILGYYDRPTDRQTNQPTDKQEDI